MEYTNERAFDWNDEIKEDGGEFELLPEGEYDFVVEKFERGRHPGSEKLPPCNKAILTLKVFDETKSTTISHNLFLHSKTEGILGAFFASIGLRKRGEPLRMDWSRVPRAKGRCKVFVNTWTGKDGAEHQSNKIKSFVYPDEAAAAPIAPAAPAYTGYTPGRF